MSKSNHPLIDRCNSEIQIENGGDSDDNWSIHFLALCMLTHCYTRQTLILSFDSKPYNCIHGNDNYTFQIILIHVNCHFFYDFYVMYTSSFYVQNEVFYVYRLSRI